MKAIRTLLACIRQADQKYNLFEINDKVVVGISGGKDSLALFYALDIYSKFEHTKFKLQPVLLDLGFPNSNFDNVINFCKNLGYELIIEDCKTVYPILAKQQVLQKLNHLPCSICSKMKKACIDKVAKRLKFNKVAFAHHLDDAIETLFMNMFYSGKVATFSPKMHLSKDDVTFIRPFIFVYEEDIKKLIKEEKINVIGSSCPADKHTTREDIKTLVNQIYKEFSPSKKNFLTLLDNKKQYNLWDMHSAIQINQKGLTIKPVYDKQDYIDELNIRLQVFIKEENIPYNKEFVKDEEINSDSYLILLKEKCIGTFRLLKEDDVIYIQRLAILPKYRNKGYASQLIKFLIKHIKKMYTPITIEVNAQYQYKYLYEKYNFKCVGKPFKEVNIKHIKMILKV